jgi:hypothetical protein
MLAGCQYLFGLTPVGPVGPLESFDPGMFESFGPAIMPSPQAIFETGSAEVTIDGTTTKLDQLVGDAAIYGTFGMDAAWTDGKGFYVRYFGPGGDGTDKAGFVTFDRIQGSSHWTTMDSGCKVDVTKSDKTGLAGTASCKDLRWADMMGGFAGGPPFVEGEAPFDASVTFEAAP